MKPDFALDFRDNQIALLHRQDGGWAAIGRVAMDDPDLDAAMAYLRATALGLSPRGVAAKLILPNDAILYTELANLPFDPQQRSRAISLGLVGRTPYDVADLIYDWTDAGASAHVAVIARETLEEAESFASQHRFNPVSFTALPDQGGYDGEVWFGASRLSETLLAQGEVVERDDVTLHSPDAASGPVSELAASDFEMGAALAEDQADDFTENDIAAGETTALDRQNPAPLMDSDLSTEPALTTASGEDIREVWQDFIADIPAPNAADQDAAPKANTAESDFLRAADTNLAPVFTPDTLQDPPPSFEEALAETPEPQIAAGPDEAPMAIDVPLIDDVPPSKNFGEKPPSRTEKMLAAFSARRTASVAKAEAQANAPRAEPAMRAAKTADLQPSLPLDTPPRSSLPVENLSVQAADSPSPLHADRDVHPVATIQSLPKLGAPDAKQGRAPEIIGATGLRPAVVQQLAAKPQPAKAQNLKAMPKSKARRPLGMGLGWILTAILLVALFAAAALSEYMLSSYNTLFGKDTAIVAAQPAPTPNAEPATKAVQNTDQIQIAAPAPNVPTATSAQELAQNDALASQAAPPVREPDVPETFVPDTDVPDTDVPDPVEPETIVPDPDAPKPDAPEQTAPKPVALAHTPSVSTADLSLPALNLDASRDDNTATAPAAFAAAILATPALVPRPPEVTRAATAAATTAVVVVTGKPALVPIPRPDVIQAAANLARQSPAVPNSDLVLAPAPDPALAGVAPLPRPANVLAAAANASPAIAAPVAGPPPAADPALANARPSARPENILAAGRVARLASASASIVAGAEAAIAEAALAPAPLAGDPNISPLSVSVSPVPAPRPQGLKSAFEQALAIAAAAPSPDPTPNFAPDFAPEPVPPAEDIASNAAPADESVEQEVGLDGRAGERSVVAKQATQRNIINLRNTNLVGIFGSKSNRYALIRQPSGSFKRLEVGDRFDGGRIAAITESEVRYEKGGELLALQMPKT